MRCGKFTGGVRCPDPVHPHYMYCAAHVNQMLATGVPPGLVVNPNDPPGLTATGWHTTAGTAVFPAELPAVPAAPEKKKAPPVVDAESIAKVICQLDLSKEKRAELASEFAEGLVELKTKFNRDSFIGYVKEYSK